MIFAIHRANNCPFLNNIQACAWIYQSNEMLIKGEMLHADECADSSPTSVFISDYVYRLWLNVAHHSFAIMSGLFGLIF